MQGLEGCGHDAIAASAKPRQFLTGTTGSKKCPGRECDRGQREIAVRLLTCDLIILAVVEWSANAEIRDGTTFERYKP